MDSIKIKVAKDFSPFPGSRYEKEGENSGEKFRRDFLAPAFKKAIDEDKKVLVDLDGTAGYGTSFLEEIFGGLVRDNDFDYKEIKKRLDIISLEEEYLEEDAWEFIDDAHSAKKSSDEASI
ncbi:STAS-like domain-containing protein [Salegentibacter salarius]|uniref:DUF4325 domain-containing protein n=1 Tax=Salegentibacter salarius TaxID=435906 RepID=A0A2N0TRH3_9FLAO|nr:STAS-like domain-containing protein [Salegentibacter salarius]OEY71751.1 DUF4325 domain-containing protein [Salegentibacter salarius]PKD17344.1 hypothetical protein APR40_03540 [Salegentibacter salarius]SLJ89459.1 protein of unknown function [Salegentibacter salarius]